MATAVYEDNWFKRMLAIVGSKVDVQTTSGEKLYGSVRTASFDCFLLNTDSGVKVVRYRDVMALSLSR